MRRWLKEYIRYISRVFLPKGWLEWAKDRRAAPEISPGTIWLTLLMGFSFQVGSLEELHRRGRQSFRKLLPGGQRPPSADTLGYSLKRADLGGIKQLFVAVMQKVRRSRMVGWVGNLRVVAMDGTGLYSSESRCCSQCQQVAHGGGRVEYRHEAVYCQTVGPEPRVFWGVEPVGPGEGEQTAALRLVAWLWQAFKHFADVVVVDAGYAKAKFINAVRGLGIHLVIRLKDERMHLVQDARGLYGTGEPSAHWTEKQGGYETQVKVWDEEGFQSWDGVEEPLRVVRIVEERSGRKIRGGPGQAVVEQREILVATTLSKQQSKAEAIREIIHRRWEIENSGFHEVKGNWHLEHCYVHQEVAIEAVLWLMLLAINLFWLFLYRNRRSFVGSDYSEREVAEWLRNELVFSKATFWRYFWDTS